MKNTKAYAFYTLKIIIYIILFFLLAFLSFTFLNSFYKGGFVTLDFDSQNLGSDPALIYYTQNPNEHFAEDPNKVVVLTDTVKGTKEVKFDEKIYIGSNWANALRIDFGSNNAGAIFSIRKISYSGDYGYYDFSLDFIKNAYLNDIEVDSYNDNTLVLKSVGNDPYIELTGFDPTPFNPHNEVYSAVVAFVLIFIINRYVRLKSVYQMFMGFFKNRRLIFSLSVNDFKTKYAGSYFGILWAFVQPICTILVFWFVFQVGLRNNNISDVPFILWFMAGLIPWFFFSDAWNNATNSLIEYSFLVKKVVFEIYILPVVKIISALFIHIFFVLFMLLIYLLYGMKANPFWLQTIYYSFCMVALVIALSYITAPLVVFFKDLGQIMNIILQFGMWLTPIMWQIDIIPKNLVWLFKLNPMYYIVQGYRDSLIYNVAFYDNIKQTIFFWVIVFVCMLVGSIIFRKLKPHFADVL